MCCIYFYFSLYKSNSVSMAFLSLAWIWYFCSSNATVSSYKWLYTNKKSKLSNPNRCGKLHIRFEPSRKRPTHSVNLPYQHIKHFKRTGWPPPFHVPPCLETISRHQSIYGHAVHGTVEIYAPLVRKGSRCISLVCAPNLIIIRLGTECRQAFPGSWRTASDHYYHLHNSTV